EAHVEARVARLEVHASRAATAIPEPRARAIAAVTARRLWHAAPERDGRAVDLDRGGQRVPRPRLWPCAAATRPPSAHRGRAHAAGGARGARASARLQAELPPRDPRSLAPRRRWLRPHRAGARAHAAAGGDGGDGLP